MTTHIHSPSAWMTGWKNGWDKPTNAAARIHHVFGHNMYSGADRLRAGDLVRREDGPQEKLAIPKGP